MLSALVVDDEKPARHDLVWMLQREADIGDICEASGGAEALKLLGNADTGNGVDVVFLDISMPDFDGLDVARMIGRFEDPPAIVFVTAFDTPASDAFDLGVVDYLRKPVAADRLRRAIGRAITARSGAAEPSEVLPQSCRIAVQARGGRQLLLGPSEVSHLESCGDYVRVHVVDESYLVRDTMTRLTNEWAPHGFVRVHRSFAVRLSAIDEVRSGPKGRSVCLGGGTELPVSRRYASDLTARLTSSMGTP